MLAPMLVRLPRAYHHILLHSDTEMRSCEEITDGIHTAFKWKKLTMQLHMYIYIYFKSY